MKLNIKQLRQLVQEVVTPSSGYQEAAEKAQHIVASLVELEEILMRLNTSSAQHPGVRAPDASYVQSVQHCLTRLDKISRALWAASSGG